jgi:endonuclease YncB( thermonuclease family)
MGLATAAEDAALLRFGEDLLAAQADARSAERGLWGPAPTLTPTRVVSTPTLTTPTLLSTLVLTATTAATSTLSP